MLNRRHFIVTSTALAATPALAALDAKDTDIKFGTTGSIYGVWAKNGDMIKSKNMRMMLMDISIMGWKALSPIPTRPRPSWAKRQT